MRLGVTLGLGLPFTAASGSQVVPPDAPPFRAAPQDAAQPGSTPGPPQLPAGFRRVDVESFPDDPRLEIVRKLLSSSRFGDAKLVAETVVTQQPTVARAEFYLGLALVKLKQYEQARPHLERAAASGQAFPERKHVPHFLGWASYHLGELDRAREEFLDHLEVVPDEADSLFGLGVISFDQDELDAAEARFHEAIAVQKGPNASRRDVSKAWIRLGDVAMRRGDAEEAEKAYMDGLALYPNHYEGWAKLARARDRLGKTKQAESARNEERRAIARLNASGSPNPSGEEATTNDAPTSPSVPTAEQRPTPEMTPQSVPQSPGGAPTR